MLQIGHYRLVREIGAGGMGQVFEACDEKTSQTVAITVTKYLQTR
jgi:serine/threonine protein kinase